MCIKQGTFTNDKDKTSIKWKYSHQFLYLGSSVIAERNDVVRLHTIPVDDDKRYSTHK